MIKFNCFLLRTLVEEMEAQRKLSSEDLHLLPFLLQSLDKFPEPEADHSTAALHHLRRRTRSQIKRRKQGLDQIKRETERKEQSRGVA